MSNELKILFYDIETTPLKAYVWGCGEQVIRHEQLCEDRNMYDIICITYCWNDGKPAKSLDWGYNKQNSKKMIQDFDKLCEKADIIIGKNNMRFDNKHITVQRLLHGLDGNPEWLKKMDDLERHMRRHFALPSQSLDYLSAKLGYGGKIKMSLRDWINIVEKLDRASFDKMITYGKKDIEDTRDLWNHCVKHFKPRHNHSKIRHEHCCATCGSKNIKRNGTRKVGNKVHQNWYCNDHGGFAGTTILTNGKESDILK